VGVEPTLTTVIGHQREKGWTIIDAGWTALSSDRGTATQDVDQGYGLVCDLAGRPITNLIVTNVNQEHGNRVFRVRGFGHGLGLFHAVEQNGQGDAACAKLLHPRQFVR